MTTRYRLFLTACVCSLLSSTVAAQAPAASSDSLRDADTAAIAGPTLANESAAFRAPARAAITADVRSGAGIEQARFTRGQTLMVVGGATVLVGAVIGDTPGQLFMVGGAVIFLIGLYEYLK